MTVKIKKGTVFELLNITPLIDVVFQLLLFFSWRRASSKRIASSM